MTALEKWRVPVADVGAVLADESRWRELANECLPKEHFRFAKTRAARVGKVFGAPKAQDVKTATLQL